MSHDIVIPIVEAYLVTGSILGILLFWWNLLRQLKKGPIHNKIVQSRKDSTQVKIYSLLVLGITIGLVTNVIVFGLFWPLALAYSMHYRPEDS